MKFWREKKFSRILLKQEDRLVDLVGLVYLVEQDQQDEPYKPGKPNQSVGFWAFAGGDISSWLE
jgi:hypothetical protein